MDLCVMDYVFLIQNKIFISDNPELLNSRRFV